MKVPESETRKNQEVAILKEIMSENFPELKKDRVPALKKLFLRNKLYYLYQSSH